MGRGDQNLVGPDPGLEMGCLHHPKSKGQWKGLKVSLTGQVRASPRFGEGGGKIIKSRPN